MNCKQQQKNDFMSSKQKQLVEGACRHGNKQMFKQNKIL